MSGRFVTFEGGEGAGKSTQARLLAETLRARGLEVASTREPGGTPGAERIRGLLLDPEGDWSGPAEILLHFAARADHVTRVIAPALARGVWVVCDRFADSTMAYQGYGSGEGAALIEALTRSLPVAPDLTLVFEVSAATRRSRLAGRAGGLDRYEARDEAFHARVADGFRRIAAAAPERCAMIAADGEVEAVRAEVERRVRGLWRLDAPAGEGRSELENSGDAT